MTTTDNNNSRGIGLAPMEGVTDLPFRLWISLASRPDFCWTPFLRVTETFPGKILPPDYMPEARYAGTVPYTLIPQIMACALTPAAATVARILEQGAAWVDLNCGCPSSRVVGHGAGSSLLIDPKHFRAFCSDLAQAAGQEKLSIKMRTGFNSSDEFPILMDALSTLPLKQLTIHGRTRPDRYDGEARWDLIHQASQSLPYPVIGSGDIVSRQSFTERVAAAPSINTVMIGRGAIRNPWIFTELRTGTPVSINGETLRAALAMFALLTILGADDAAPLIARLREGYFMDSCGTDGGAWISLYEKICRATFGEVIAPSALPMHRAILGRVKMVWHSLRSSLPEELFSPALMRSSTFAELDAGIATILAQLPHTFICHHQPHHDWLYSSSKKNPTALQIATEATD